jgi:hypothetical protein
LIPLTMGKTGMPVKKTFPRFFILKSFSQSFGAGGMAPF